MFQSSLSIREVLSRVLHARPSPFLHDSFHPPFSSIAEQTRDTLGVYFLGQGSFQCLTSKSRNHGSTSLFFPLCRC